jgi:hypothetical protein
MIIDYRTSSQVKRNTYDPVGHTLRAAVGIEPGHTLYLLLYDVAVTARQHRLPINLDTLAFTIARTPSFSARWAAHEQADDMAQRIGVALKEYVTPAGKAAA